MSECQHLDILLVGDGPALTECMRESVPTEDGQFRVESVDGATDGLDELTTGGFDCVVSAYDLPEQTGVEFLEAVRRRFDGTPFVLFSAERDEMIASEAVSAGVTEYVPSDACMQQPGLLLNRIRTATEQVEGRSRQVSRHGSRFEAIFDTSQRLIAVLTPDGTVRNVNQTAMKYIEASRNAVTDSLFWETPWWDEEARPDVERWITAAADGEYVEYSTDKVQFGDSTQTVSGDIVPVTDTDGTVTELIVLAEDTAEHGQRERKLAKTREQLSLALDAANAAVWEMDIKTGELYWDERAQELWGYEPGEFGGTLEEFADPVHPDDWDKLERAYQTAIETRTGYTVDIRISHDEEPVRWVKAAGQVVTNKEGEPWRLIGLSTDITERKKREKAIERLHGATRDLMTATTIEEAAARASETATQVLKLPMNGIHLFDAETNALVPVAWANDTEDVLDGPPPALPVDDSLAGQVYRTGNAQIFTQMHEADGTFNPETLFESEYILPLDDHGVFIFSSAGTDAFDAADEALADVFAENITAALDYVEQRQELQRERDRLDEFAGIISHDLRNPLNVATTRMELAQAECDSDHLDDVAQAHDRMDALISDVLTLTREGTQVEDPGAVDLADTVDRCWRNVQTDEATLVTETEQTVHAEPGRLKQLLENLFRNAVEHGGATVTVTVGDLADEQGFYVADDGLGIPEDHRGEAFDAGYSTADEGTGLGLGIALEIAEAHGWDIAVTESETGGARFEITGTGTASQ